MAGVSNFDNFTNEARDVLTNSMKEADRLNHNFLGTEHLLLGLLATVSGGASSILAEKVSLEQARQIVAFYMGKGDVPATEFPLTPRAKLAIERAVDESRRHNCPFITSEHLLLSLLLEGEGIGAGVLESSGITIDELSEATKARMLATGSGDNSLANNSVVLLLLDLSDADFARLPSFYKLAKQIRQRALPR